MPPESEIRGFEEEKFGSHLVSQTISKKSNYLNFE